MKEIQLTQGQVALIDDEDWELVSKYKWHAFYNKYTKSFYARSKIKSPGNKQTTIHMHRLVMNTSKSLPIDHRDHNTLNNQKLNLRECTVAENAQNSKKPKNNSSGFKGVYWDKWSNRWKAHIRINGKQTHLGRFDTPEAAHAAYCEAGKLHCGEFFNPG